MELTPIFPLLHLWPRAPQLIELLTNKAEDVTGGSIALGDDPVEVSNNIEAHIMKKEKHWV